MHAHTSSRELWAMTGMFKWAIHEGVQAFPIDFAVRGTLTEVVAPRNTSSTLMHFVEKPQAGFAAPHVATAPWIISRSGG